VNSTRSHPNRRSVPLYISYNHGYEDHMTLNETISQLEGFANTVSTVQSIQPGTITGITFSAKRRLGLETNWEPIQAFESYFKTNESTDLDIGWLVTEEKFKQNNNFFRKLHYIIIDLEVNLVINARTLADKIVNRCDAHQEYAKLRNFRAKVLCTVDYPSNGVNTGGTTGNLDKFSTFWCRIAEHLKSGYGHANIIMKAAFDKSYNAFSFGTMDQYSTALHNGWWIRHSDILTNESAYTEKIECKLIYPINNDFFSETKILCV